MIKAIVFDCYGTLINTGNGSIKATELLNTHKSNVDPQEILGNPKRMD